MSFKLLSSIMLGLRYNSAFQKLLKSLRAVPVLAMLWVLCGCAADKPTLHYPYIIAAEQFSTSFLVLNPNVDPCSREAIVWRYNPAVHWDFDDKYLRKFRNPSEAKIVENGSKLLFTCSGGACGLIDLATEKLDWLVFAGGNPHSAEILPDGNAVTASSIGSHLMLWDLKKDIKGSVSKKYMLPSAHGVVWDPQTQLIYACGKHGIVSYKYDPEKVELTQVRIYNLDRKDIAAYAHDLLLDPCDGKLLVTVTRGLVKVDQISGAFEVITPQRYLKSASISPAAGTLVMMATRRYWSDELHKVDEQGRIVDFIRLPHMQFYKARWISDNENMWIKNKQADLKADKHE